MVEFITRVDKIESIYEVNDKLGKGLHATVFDAKELSTGHFHALKISKKAITKKKKNDAQELFLHESNILRQLDHDHIIKFFALYEYPYHFAIGMERLYGGELFDYIASQEEIVELDSKRYAKQVLKALEYIHSKHIAHLDLKPENIMMVDTNMRQLKIIDFSLSCHVTPEEPVKQLGGTTEFMAPEAINYDFIGPETDMWSFGVLLYMLLTGCSPYLADNDETTQANIIRNNIDYDIEEMQFVSINAIELIKRLLVINMKDRITARECLRNEWFAVEPRLRLRKSSSISTKGFSDFQARKKWIMGTRKIIRINQQDKLNNTL